MDYTYVGGVTRVLPLPGPAGRGLGRRLPGVPTHCPGQLLPAVELPWRGWCPVVPPARKWELKFFEPADATRSESDRYVGVNVAPFDGGEEWRPHGARTIGPLGRWTSSHAML